MAKKCKKCQQETGRESIGCNGFCLDMYHNRCVSLTNEESASCWAGKTMWMCEHCLQIMKTLRYRESLLALRKYKESSTNVDATLKVDDPAIFELRTEVAAINATVSELMNSVRELTRIEKKTTADFVSSPANTNPPTSSTVLNSTPITANNSDLSSSSASCGETIWLHFSRISSDVTENDMEKMITECLKCDETVIVKRLIPYGVDPTTYGSISFKACINAKFWTAASLFSTWPREIRVKRFEQRTQLGLWRPADSSVR